MKRQGSALIYVIVVIFSITSVVLMSARIASSTEQGFNNHLEAAQFKTQSDGAIAEAIADAHKGTLAVGNRTTAYSNRSVSTRVTAHPSMSRAYQLEVTGTTEGRTYQATRTIGNRTKPHPLYYGMWSALDHNDNRNSTTIEGSLYVGGTATFEGNLVVSEDALIRGSWTMSSPAVIGHTLTGVRTQVATAVSSAAYLAAGTSLASGTVGDINFGAADATGYPLQTRVGNYTLSGGVISGRGTIYVSGTLTIDGNYNYADAQSRVLFIVGGRVRVQSNVTSIVGSYFATGRATLNSPTLSVLRGNICTADRVDRSGTVNLVQDMAFLDSAAECLKHRVPGIWTP